MNKIILIDMSMHDNFIFLQLLTCLTQLNQLKAFLHVSNLDSRHLIYCWISLLSPKSSRERAQQKTFSFVDFFSAATKDDVFCLHSQKIFSLSRSLEELCCIEQRTRAVLEKWKEIKQKNNFSEIQSKKKKIFFSLIK